MGLKPLHTTGAGLVAAFLLITGSAAAQVNAPVKLTPKTMAKIGAVDERFQSFNMEMVEVTGGRFWKPYASRGEAAAPKAGAANAPAGMDPNLYEYRPPIDLSNPRLRKLAAALGPMYLRVSGTWANTTYFAPDGDASTAAPAGFKGVLTGKEWRGVVDFSRAANSSLVTSFATSAGTRDAAAVWTPKEAEKVASFTQAEGGKIAAAELMNEPTFAAMAGVPKGYDAAAFARDIAAFRAFQKKSAPGMLVLGPGGVGEGSLLTAGGPMQMLPTEDLMKATGPAFDVFTYHSYGAVSSRCAPAGAPGGTSAEAALSADWLDKADHIEQFYAVLRDRFEPGKPIWLTETAQAACGGDRWAATFLDSFRYLDQLGDLAKRGVQVHMHNTLAASDYGLLDEKSYEPRPNYWAALLWRRLMGQTVLNAAEPEDKPLRVYAQCLRGHAGGVVVLAINTDKTAAATLETAAASERYTLTAKELTSKQVLLNGHLLALGSQDALPPIIGVREKPGQLLLAPASITFLAFPAADNAACR